MVTLTVTGCDVTAELGEMTTIENGQEYRFGEKEEKVIECPIKFNVTGCNVHDENSAAPDPDHGYTVEWTVDKPGMEIEPSEKGLKLTAANLPEEPTAFTLTAALKDPKGTVIGEKQVAFTAQKYIAPVCGAVLESGLKILSPVGTVRGDTTEVPCVAEFKVTGGENCTEHENDPNHGYWVKWEFTPDNNEEIPGVEFKEETGTFIITSKDLPTTSIGGSLKATVMKTTSVYSAGGSGEETGVSTRTHVDFLADDITCTAVPQKITLETKESFDKIAGEKSGIPFTAKAEWTVNNCPAHANPEEHGTLTWSIVDPGPDWVDLIDTGTGEIKVNAENLPAAENNKVTLKVLVKNDNGEKEATAELAVSRAPICKRKFAKIDKITGQPVITVVQGRDVIETYTVEKEDLHEDDGICDFGEQHANGHGDKVKWEIIGITGEAEMEKKAITIDEEGRLVVHGAKLQENNTYDVTILAKTAGGGEKACTVRVNCAAPDPTPSTTSNSNNNGNNDVADFWGSYEDKIADAKKGGTVKMDLTANAEVPFYVFESARGQDVTLQMKMGRGYTWSVNGKTLQKLPAWQIYIPMDIQPYSEKKMLRLCRDYEVKTFKLRHTGSFYGDMKLTMDVGEENAQKTMYLYSYDEEKERLTYQANALADGDGDVSFVFARSLGAYAVTSKALYGEQPVSGGGGLVGDGNGSTAARPPAAPASSASRPGSGSGSSGESSPESSEPAPPPTPPSSSREPAAPVETALIETEPEKGGFPILVPVLILGLAGVITATVLVIRSGRGRLGNEFDEV